MCRHPWPAVFFTRKPKLALAAAITTSLSLVTAYFSRAARKAEWDGFSNLIPGSHILRRVVGHDLRAAMLYSARLLATTRTLPPKCTMLTIDDMANLFLYNYFSTYFIKPRAEAYCDAALSAASVCASITLC